MSFSQAGNSLSLFSQQAAPLAAPDSSSFKGVPQLDVPWGSFRQSLGSSMRTLFARSPKKFLSGGFFRDCWIESSIPQRAVMLAASMAHYFSGRALANLPAHARANPALENFQLTWSSPVNDLPPLQISAAIAKPSPRGDPAKPLANEGADAFHPPPAHLHRSRGSHSSSPDSDQSRCARRAAKNSSEPAKHCSVAARRRAGETKNRNQRTVAHPASPPRASRRHHESGPIPRRPRRRWRTGANRVSISPNAPARPNLN